MLIPVGGGDGGVTVAVVVVPVAVNGSVGGITIYFTSVRIKYTRK